jgi:hypothetical protein
MSWQIAEDAGRWSWNRPAWALVGSGYYLVLKWVLLSVVYWFGAVLTVAAILLPVGVLFWYGRLQNWRRMRTLSKAVISGLLGIAIDLLESGMQRTGFSLPWADEIASTLDMRSQCAPTSLALLL